MRKYLFYSGLVLSGVWMSVSTVAAQGPVTPTNGVVGKSEMVVIWENSMNGPSSEVGFFHHYFSLKKDFETISNKSDRLESYVRDTLAGNYGNRMINAVAGDFDGDSKDEYVTIIQGMDNTLSLDLARMGQQGTKSFSRSYLAPGPLSQQGVPYRGNVYTSVADLNKNGKDELVLAWVSEDDSLVITLLGLKDDSLQVVKRLAREKVVSLSENDLIGLQTSDIDENGDQELALIYYSETPAEGLYIQLYRFAANDDYSYEMQDRFLFDEDIAAGLRSNGDSFYLNLTSGDFDGDGKREFLVVLMSVAESSELIFFPIHMGDDPGTPEVDPLESFSINNEEIDRNSLFMSYEYPDIASGDVNGDGVDDILLGSSDIEVFHTTPEGGFDFISKYVDWMWGTPLSYLSLANVDNNPDNGDEIIYALNISEDINFYVVGSDANFGFSQIAYRNLGTWGKNLNSFAMVTGDFDGDMFRIGPGKKYTRTDIVQPLVILNAPPTHFDMFEDEIYDVNNCHDGASCSSYATYTAVSSEEISVSTTLQKSWGISSTISGGGSFLGASVRGYLTAEYGENFEKSTGSSQTVVISQQVTATYDDQIYATVCDYEIWEYPVYNRNGVIKGNILTLEPTLSENRWFPSKERSANGYIPKHEVGNILSYTPYTDLINPDGEDKIRGSYGTDSYDLDANTNVNFNVNLSNTFNDTEVKGRRIGVEAGASVSAWGIEVSGSARYDESQLSTHSVSVSKGLDITVHLGGVNRSIGETGYNVTPYIYWSKNGALVVDYAVRPILPEPGGTETWWSESYDRPDPSFILPWKLDPEKGLTLQDEVKRMQTKSIMFSPAEPESGDTVLIRAYVHNFSPYPTADAIPVSFYVGDPDAGGTLIKDIHGESLFFTVGLVDAQAFSEVSLRWVVPAGLPSFPRIFGVINPGGGMNEVHTFNNKGWVILGKSDAEGPVPVIGNPAGDADWISVYPNPARELLNFRPKMEISGPVSIEILDIRGRTLKIETYRAFPGTGEEFSIPVNDLDPGFYLYRIQNGEFAETGKFLRAN